MHEYAHGSDLTSVEVVANGLLIQGDIMVKSAYGLEFLASEQGPAFMIVIDHHSRPLREGVQLLKKKFPALYAKTYFVADFTGTKAACTLASEFFEGLVTFTDMGNKILKTTDAIDLFKTVADEDESFKNSLVGWFDSNGFEACHPRDVFKLFRDPDACLRFGRDIFNHLGPRTQILFGTREVIYKDEELVVFWMHCSTSYNKEMIQTLMNAEGLLYGSAAVIFATHHENTSGAGMCSVGFRIAQQGRFAEWGVKMQEQCDFDFSTGTRCALLNVSTLASNVSNTNTKSGFREGGGHEFASRTQIKAASDVGQNVNLLKRKVCAAAFIQLVESAEEFRRFQMTQPIALDVSSAVYNTTVPMPRRE